ncbi:MucR family transcriptional regulator [Methylobacterium oxalidis]|uniref:MucR family transcriptional regulator n=1 Tax=Methylobacterium oxalidis TaxID=944322 RepID=A0A512JDF7_9HYPH|nr:MucR family transcriptional regulator [Methylobacterium oxalidis]GEP07989.1 hypothetical protein MOX02_60270 [Methylobacterium oxalidis]GJE31143.1 Transcriptional regulatory protein ros [Methylobacterium oxalidis]GLS66117.1 hypothetical protein GCM10007888_44990 [Methylobacterium oxalidis]
MSGLKDRDETEFIGLTRDIVSAFVTNNPLPYTQLPALIACVHAAIKGLTTYSGAPETSAELEKATPAQIRKSITPDALISFIDGSPYKTLKRHLSTHGHDPHSYRQRYGLPSDYPMVAANYASKRSEIARSLGLGRTGGRSQEDLTSERESAAAE